MFTEKNFIVILRIKPYHNKKIRMELGNTLTKVRLKTEATTSLLNYENDVANLEIVSDFYDDNSKKPIWIIGNGFKVHQRPSFRNKYGEVQVTRKGILKNVLPLSGGSVMQDEVNFPFAIHKIHFVPEDSKGKKVYDEGDSEVSEKPKLKLDCVSSIIKFLEGVISTQFVFGSSSYLLADTNPQFASFLVHKFGFSGNGALAWIKISDLLKNLDNAIPGKTFSIREYYNDLLMRPQSHNSFPNGTNRDLN